MLNVPSINTGKVFWKSIVNYMLNVKIKAVEN